MKPSALQGFVRDWLAVRGLTPTTVEPDVWQFTVPKDLRDRFGRSELTFSFSRRAIQKNPKSELATVGNPVFDRLLSVAREEGRVGLGFTKSPSPPPKAPPPEKIEGADGVKPGKAEAVYQAIYHFVFTISYPSIEASDEMEVVSVDSATLEVWAQTPDLSDLWGTLEPEPRKGRHVLPALPVPQRSVETATRAFERRMRRRIKKVEQACLSQLELETASIKAYYEQLIEEARNQSRRWSTRVEDREDRIRFLQLEWKRRTEEANEFWMPQVNARLVALGIQMQPRVAYRVASARAGSRAGGRGSIRVWDEATRKLLAPYCEDCGRTGLADPKPRPGGGFLCPDCASKGPGAGKAGAGAAERVGLVLLTKTEGDR